jgi:hypothetical protein
MLNELISEFQSLEEQIVEDAASQSTPRVKPRYDATPNTVRRTIGQLTTAGISTPQVERLAWGIYWSSEEAGNPLTFRQGHVEVEAQQVPGIPPRLTIHEWLFDHDRRTTRGIAILT